MATRPRQAAYMARRRARGYERVCVDLDPEVVAMLDELADIAGSRIEVIRWAIRLAHARRSWAESESTNAGT